MIDTLILSGGGPSGVAYVGIFKALIERGILNQDCSGINEIITTSVGIIFSLLYMLKMNMDQQEKLMLKIDTESFLDLSKLEIDNLLVGFGLFDNDKLGEYINSFIRNVLNEENITLKKLYDKIPIKLTVKVFNITKKNLEYINYETDPNLSLSRLGKMTTAIPFFFRPVEYNGNFYVDGGLRGHYPIEQCKTENYLGIFIQGGSVPQESELYEWIPILKFIHSLMINQDDIVHQIKDNNYSKKDFFIEINQGLDFHLTRERKLEMIEIGYNKTLQHIDNYLTEN
jgi:NTE family protein